MKVLITGGAGFIGSHLVERLTERGDEVTVLDNFNDFYDPAIKRRNLAGVPSVEVVEGDVRDTDLVKKTIAGGASTPSCTWPRWRACVPLSMIPCATPT